MQNSETTRKPGNDPRRWTTHRNRAWFAMLAGCGIGAAASLLYLLLDGEYLFGIPAWAAIVFYPDFAVGNMAYDAAHLAWLAKTAGVLSVAVSYAIIALLAERIWHRVRPAGR